MKRVRLIKDIYIMGYGTLKNGTEFKVKRYNTRFVYVEFGKCELMLSRKDVEKVY